MYSHSSKIQDGSNFIDETGCLRSLRPLDDCGRIEDCDDGKLIQVKSYLIWSDWAHFTSKVFLIPFRVSWSQLSCISLYEEKSFGTEKSGKKDQASIQ